MFRSGFFAAMAVATLVAPGAALAQAKTCGPAAEEISRSVANGTTTLKCRRYDPLRSFPALIAASIDLHVIKKDGRARTAEEMAGKRFEFGDRLTTGPAGRAHILLPDETIFTLGPDSDMVIDDFIYDPATGKNTITATVAKGAFRFVTGKVQRQRDLNVKIAVGTIGIRGTDIEFNQSPDGSGYVKLYSGQAELTPHDTEKTIELQAGQMMSWTNFTRLSAPKPIE
jgi:hypothetical protein